MIHADQYACLICRIPFTFRVTCRRVFHRSLRLVSQSLRNQYLADPDVQLMLRVSTGDNVAFEDLMLRYQDRLVGFFFHLLHDRPAAEDMAQETFLRIYRSRDRYEPTAKFSTWLFRIAHNLASNLKRSSGRRREISLASSADSAAHELQPEASSLAERSGLMPTRQLESREVRDVVRMAIDELSERQRTAVVLHKFEDMSYEEIGEIMGLGTIAVKSLLSRARLKLRESLERFL
jgi:RNA polymerase sigma-70 factor (ECF subfamily)